MPIDLMLSLIVRNKYYYSISPDDATFEKEVPMKCAYIDDDEILQDANDDNGDDSLLYHSIPSSKNHSVDNTSDSSEDTSLQSDYSVEDVEYHNDGTNNPPCDYVSNNTNIHVPKMSVAFLY